MFALPAGLDGGPLYARVIRLGRAVTDLQFSASTLHDLLQGAAAHARIIDIAFGALMAMGLSALLIRLVLKDQIYPLYGCVFLLQALYLAYFSGQGFTWPLLSWARPFANYAYNVPVALSAAVAALFVREFANLRIFSPRVYSAFGWLAVAFGVLTLSNVLRVFGFGVLIARIGNLMFLGTAILTLVVAFLAWRRGGNRAAGWFLIAWSLLCTFQIATAVRLLYTRADSAEGIVYYGLAPSMVAAAVLIALGVSDHVRQQSLALTDAERRAQTDPLTGVLNRRSLIERLDAACLRAAARNLPISVLFIDLDHFKQINDTFGHAAGDACLAGIIPPIQAELRQSDVIGRYGGEEFVVILNGADAAAAHPIAERICRRVADIRIEGFGSADPAHLQHRGGRLGHPRGVGPAPDRARRHGGLCRQALGPQPGAARRGAPGLSEAAVIRAPCPPSDIPQLLALVRRYWEFEGLGHFDALRVELLLQHLVGDRARGQVWVAEERARSSGYLVLVYVVSLEHQGLMAEIDEFFVCEARGPGLAERAARGGGGGAARAAACGCSCRSRRQRGRARLLRAPRLSGPRGLRRSSTSRWLTVRG